MQGSTGTGVNMHRGQHVQGSTGTGVNGHRGQRAQGSCLAERPPGSNLRPQGNLKPECNLRPQRDHWGGRGEGGVI